MATSGPGVEMNEHRLRDDETADLAAEDIESLLDRMDTEGGDINVLRERISDWLNRHTGFLNADMFRKRNRHRMINDPDNIRSIDGRYGHTIAWEEYIPDVPGITDIRIARETAKEGEVEDASFLVEVNGEETAPMEALDQFFMGTHNVGERYWDGFHENQGDKARKVPRLIMEYDSRDELLEEEDISLYGWDTWWTRRAEKLGLITEDEEPTLLGILEDSKVAQIAQYRGEPVRKKLVETLKDARDVPVGGEVDLTLGHSAEEMKRLTDYMMRKIAETRGHQITVGINGYDSNLSGYGRLPDPDELERQVEIDFRRDSGIEDDRPTISDYSTWELLQEHGMLFDLEEPDPRNSYINGRDVLVFSDPEEVIDAYKHFAGFPESAGATEVYEHFTLGRSSRARKEYDVEDVLPHLLENGMLTVHDADVTDVTVEFEEHELVNPHRRDVDNPWSDMTEEAVSRMLGRDIEELEEEMAENAASVHNKIHEEDEGDRFDIHVKRGDNASSYETEWRNDYESPFLTSEIDRNGITNPTSIGSKNNVRVEGDQVVFESVGEYNIGVLALAPFREELESQGVGLPYHSDKRAEKKQLEDPGSLDEETRERLEELDEEDYIDFHENGKINFRTGLDNTRVSFEVTADINEYGLPVAYDTEVSSYAATEQLHQLAEIMDPTVESPASYDEVVIPTEFSA